LGQPTVFQPGVNLNQFTAFWSCNNSPLTWTISIQTTGTGSLGSLENEEEDIINEVRKRGIEKESRERGMEWMEKEKERQRQVEKQRQCIKK